MAKRRDSVWSGLNIFINENLQEGLRYLGEIRNYVLFSLFLFLVFAIIGFGFPIFFFFLIIKLKVLFLQWFLEFF